VIDRAALVASFVAPATYGALFVLHTWINELIKGRRALPPIETLSAILTTTIIFTIFGFFLVAPFTVYVGVPIASLARRRQIASPIFYGSAGAFTGAIFACLYLVINGLSLVPSSLQGLLEFLKVVTAGVAGGIAYWSIAVPSSDIPEAKLS
jgi:hypothetical protein